MNTQLDKDLRELRKVVADYEEQNANSIRELVKQAKIISGKKGKVDEASARNIVYRRLDELEQEQLKAEPLPDIRTVGKWTSAKPAKPVQAVKPARAAKKAKPSIRSTAMSVKAAARFEKRLVNNAILLSTLDVREEDISSALDAAKSKADAERVKEEFERFFEEKFADIAFYEDRRILILFKATRTHRVEGMVRDLPKIIEKLAAMFMCIMISPISDFGEDDSKDDDVILTTVKVYQLNKGARLGPMFDPSAGEVQNCVLKCVYNKLKSAKYRDFTNIFEMDKQLSKTGCSDEDIKRLIEIYPIKITVYDRFDNKIQDYESPKFKNRNMAIKILRAHNHAIEYVKRKLDWSLPHDIVSEDVLDQLYEKHSGLFEKYQSSDCKWIVPYQGCSDRIYITPFPGQNLLPNCFSQASVFKKLVFNKRPIMRKVFHNDHIDEIKSVVPAVYYKNLEDKPIAAGTQIYELDMKAAYTQYKKCKFFRGFPINSCIKINYPGASIINSSNIDDFITKIKQFHGYIRIDMSEVAAMSLPKHIELYFQSELQPIPKILGYLDVAKRYNLLDEYSSIRVEYLIASIGCHNPLPDLDYNDPINKSMFIKFIGRCAQREHVQMYNFKDKEEMLHFININYDSVVDITDHSVHLKKKTGWSNFDLHNHVISYQQIIFLEEVVKRLEAGFRPHIIRVDGLVYLNEVSNDNDFFKIKNTVLKHPLGVDRVRLFREDFEKPKQPIDVAYPEYFEFLQKRVSVIDLPAGYGKSYLIQQLKFPHIYSSFKHLIVNRYDNTHCLGKLTANSLLSVGTSDDNDSYKILDKTNLLIFDEFSELNCTHHKRIKKLVSQGYRVVLLGDSRQLPPVQGNMLESKYYHHINTLFGEKPYNRRADKNTLYDINFLTRCRMGELTKADQEFIKSRTISADQAVEMKSTIITFKNDECHKLNEKKLRGRRAISLINAEGKRCKFIIGTPIICIRQYDKAVGGSRAMSFTTIRVGYMTKYTKDITLYLKNYRPAYAITSHRAQGLTIQGSVVVNKNLLLNLFSPEQLFYVACSRVTDLNNLWFYDGEYIESY